MQANSTSVFTSGGHFVFLMAERHFISSPEFKNFEKELKEIESEGRWKCVTRRSVPAEDYICEMPAVMFVFEML